MLKTVPGTLVLPSRQPLHFPPVMGLLSGSLALLLLLQVPQCLALVLTQIAPWRAGGVLTLRASGGGGGGGHGPQGCVPWRQGCYGGPPRTLRDGAEPGTPMTQPPS